MSIHKLMQQAVEPTKDHRMQQREGDVDDKPRPAASGFVVRSGIRAGVGEMTSTASDWWQGLQGFGVK